MADTTKGDDSFGVGAETDQTPSTTTTTPTPVEQVSASTPNAEPKDADPESAKLAAPGASYASAELAPTFGTTSAPPKT